MCIPFHSKPLYRWVNYITIIENWLDFTTKIDYNINVLNNNINRNNIKEQMKNKTAMHAIRIPYILLQLYVLYFWWNNDAMTLIQIFKAFAIPYAILFAYAVIVAKFSLHEKKENLDDEWK